MPLRQIVSALVYCSISMASMPGSSLAAMSSGPRLQRPGCEDEQSLFAIGNGRMIAYLKGPEVTHIWGPPYSSPNLARIELRTPPGLTTVSSREGGSAIWHHTLGLEGESQPVITITDFMDSDLPCMIRIIESKVFLEMVVYTENARRTCAGGRYDGRHAMLCTHPAGSLVYGYRLHSQHPMTIQLLVEGSLCFGSSLSAVDPLVIKISPGRGQLTIVGGPELPQCISNTDMALRTGVDNMLTRTRTWWNRELTQVTVPDSGIGRMGRIAEDVAVNIITQQAVEGAVLAGHNYCLAYVRDQLGVARGLLDLGLHQRARQILAYYWNVFQRVGRIQNAQTIGGWPDFHVHENDEVELTSYIILQAFEYLDRTGDVAFVREIFPMLSWAFDIQRGHIEKDMLPFNGDETYIAGDILPRSCMDHGSAESTYLFFASGYRLADWAESQGLWDIDKADAARGQCQQVQSAFSANFVVDGRIMLNNPARAEGLNYPRFRHGVCQARLPGCLFFGWLERKVPGRYCCERCFVNDSVIPPASSQHFLASVALTPVFVGFPIESRPIGIADLDAALVDLRDADGKLGYGSCRLPGYELGFLLYAMSELGHADGEHMAELLVGLLDPTGAWVEYYQAGQPQGTRYRPWESAINYSALVNFSMKMGRNRAAKNTP
ncbi:MAG: hypothetical protein GXY44_15445 [Phycisphaerales bacterium]|nr:hypothetical protein [Phycisphaerales bacterium]